MLGKVVMPHFEVVYKLLAFTYIIIENISLI
jgi:hypothetical protein